jgi:hypothetical protein
MADDVLIQIGATTDKLDAASAKAREQIVGLKNQVESLADGFKKLGEVVGLALTIEGVKRFVESMAALGEETEIMMGRLGQTAEQIGVLSGIAKMTGSSIEGLAMSMERASLNVQRSTVDALGPQAQALKVLGLNAKELVGLAADQYFLKLADAVSKFNPGLNLTNALMVVGGRGVAQMIPALQLGREGFARLQEQIKASQDGLARAIPGMADTHTKLELMGLSVQSLGARVFTVLKPAIDWAVTSFTAWVRSLDSATIQAAVLKVVNFTGAAVIAIGTFFQTLVEAIGKAIEKMDQMAAKAKGVAAGMAGGALGGAIGGGLVAGPPGAIIGGIGGAVVGGMVGGSEIADRIAGSFKSIDEQVKLMEAQEPAWAATIR